MRRLYLMLVLLGCLASETYADVLVAKTFEAKIVRLDELTGEQVPGWEIDATSLGGYFLSGIAVSDNGVIYATSGTNSAVMQFDAETGAAIAGGIFAILPANPNPEPNQPDIPASPGAIQFGPDGLLYVGDNTGTRVHRYNTTTAALVDSPVDGLVGVGGLGFQSNGVLLSTEFLLGAQNGIYAGFGTPPSPALVDASVSPVIGAKGLLVNDDDSFLVVDMITNQIHSFAANGTPQGDFAMVPFPADVDPFNLPEDWEGAFNFGSDILRAPDGDILVGTLGINSVFQVASKNYGEIIRYSPDGSAFERLAIDQSPIGALAFAPGVVTTPGDYDRSGEVDSDDYTVWREAFGSLVTPFSNADGNGDGIINAADYAVWRNNLASTPQVGVAPEPASVVLLTFLLAGIPQRSPK